MDAHDPATVFSWIDDLGSYAYGNQPNIVQWNLARLAETLLPLLANDEAKALAAAEESLGSFAATFHLAYLGGLRRKLGDAAVALIMTLARCVTAKRNVSVYETRGLLVLG